MKSGLHPDWLVPDWPAPPNLRAVFTSRAGGQSGAPFDSMNLGDHVGDDLPAVLANRERLGQVIEARPVFLQQVHGVDVVRLPAPQAAGATLKADACFTSQTLLACTVMVADCLPVLFCTADGRVVGAAHAGWRGLCEGVLEATVQALLREAGARLPAQACGPGEVMAWLGPAIGPTAFEVGAEVREQFLRASRDAGLTSERFRPAAPGKFMADLAGLARERLQAAGVHRIHGNDSSAPWCTAGNPKRYFSHRRDATALGGTGRMAACVWLADVA